MLVDAAGRAGVADNSTREFLPLPSNRLFGGLPPCNWAGAGQSIQGDPVSILCHTEPAGHTHILKLCEVRARDINLRAVRLNNAIRDERSHADITGIDPPVLRGVDPTTRPVAVRMSWASTRLTTRLEDEAYCLMGLFNVFMPMLYGEGERAFIRLQEEIMRQTEDNTIFAWKCSKLEPRHRGLFARSPSEFKSSMHSGAKVPCGLQGISPYKILDQRLHSPPALTSRGLLIGLPLWRKGALQVEAPKPQEVTRARGRGFFHLRRFRDSGDGSELRPGTYLALICRIESGNKQKGQILCIWLQKHAESGVFTRLWPQSVTLLPEKRAADFRIHTMYVLPSGSSE